MTVVLSDDLFRMKLPETSIMIAAGSNQVCGVSAESAVPDPALVTSKSALQLEWDGIGWLPTRDRNHLVEILDLPNFGSVVSGTGCKVLDIRREQNSGDVLAMSLEVGDGDEGGLFAVLLKMPDENVALESVSWACRRDMHFDHSLLTELLPAQRVEPSLATVTLETETSSSGIN